MRVLLLNADIRAGTKKIYCSRFAHFATYCSKLNLDPKTCPEEVIVNFLTYLRRTHNYKYQTINGYRSAISKYHVGFHGTPAGCSKNVQRVSKAIFLEVPPIPKYGDIWPAAQLANYLESLHPPDTLSNYQLGMKTLGLISLHSLSRSSTVAQLSCQYQDVGEHLVFPLLGLEKQSRHGHVRGELQIPAGPPGNPALNIALYCAAYMKRTEDGRSFYAVSTGSRPDRLFISNTKVFTFHFLAFSHTFVSALPACATLHSG